MTDEIATVDGDGLELRGQRSLKRSGSMIQAMRVYTREMWNSGDERLALARIGRRPKTLDGYKRSFPDFAKEVEDAKEHHREQARGAVIGMLPRAIEVFEGNLEQPDLRPLDDEGNRIGEPVDVDHRLANINAIHVLKNEGVLGKEKQPEQEQHHPRVTKITYMDHPTFNAPQPPIPTELADDDDS